MTSMLTNKNVIFYLLIPIFTITVPTTTNCEVTTAAKMCKIVREKNQKI